MSNVVHLPVISRPRFRGDCLPPNGRNARRPCTYSRCYWHGSSLSSRRSGARAYGLCILDLAEEPHTLEEVGAAMGVSRENVRQIEDKALHKLRRRGVTIGTLHLLAGHDFQYTRHALVDAEEP